MKKYIRVETMDTETDTTVGGYVSVAQALLAMRLGAGPLSSAEELADLINESEDPKVLGIVASLYMLGDIPLPEIYEHDKEGYVCLYRMEEYRENYPELSDINDFIMDMTGCGLYLICKEFFIRDEEIVYEDSYQIVISRETYEKHNKNKKHADLLCYEP